MTDEGGAAASSGRTQSSSSVWHRSSSSRRASPLWSTYWSETGRRPSLRSGMPGCGGWCRRPPVLSAACSCWRGDGGLRSSRWEANLPAITVSSAPSSSERRANTYPGAVWAMLGRSELARREGYERSIAYSSVALSVIGCYLAAALTALVLAVVALIGGSIDMPWWPIALVAAVGIIAHPSRSQSPNPRLGQSSPRAHTDGRDPELGSLSASHRFVHTGVDLDCCCHDAGHEVAGGPSADRTRCARRRRELDHRVHHAVTRRDRGARGGVRGGRRRGRRSGRRRRDLGAGTVRPG